MLKLIYIAISIPLMAVLSIAAAAVTFGLASQFLGPLGGVAFGLVILIMGMLAIAQFIALEGFDRPILSWLPLRDGFERPVAVKLLWEVAMWILVALFVYYGRSAGH